LEDTFRKLPGAKQLYILKAAAKVFAQEGYYQANVADICKQAGISNGALYKYFKNKESVYRSIFDFMVDTLVSEVFAKHSGSTAPLYETLSTIFHDVVGLAKTHSDLLAIYTDIGSCAMNELSSSVSRQLEEVAKEFWMELVEKAKKKGEIRENIMDEAAAYYIDNHLNLLIYSLSSKHFDMRLQIYFRKEDEDMTDEQKVSLLMKSVKMIFN
jgi:TetR/AcrR family transcriptional regulator